MTPRSLGIIVVVLLIIAAGGVWYWHSHDIAHAPTLSQQEMNTTQPMASSTDTTASSTNDMNVKVGVNINTALPAPLTITYTDSGFSPKNVNIITGQTVTFVNKSSHGMWVASDAHPTHTQYDGTSKDQHCTGGKDNNGSFDECSPVSTGGSYSFTFEKAGTFTFHNHVAAQDTGTVTVATKINQ